MITHCVWEQCVLITYMLLLRVLSQTAPGRKHILANVLYKSKTNKQTNVCSAFVKQTGNIFAQKLR